LLKHNQLNREKVAGALKVTWERVLQELIDQVIDLMPRRLAAVRKAKG
jgi:hypothetical protein